VTKVRHWQNNKKQTAIITLTLTMPSSIHLSVYASQLQMPLWNSLIYYTDIIIERKWNAKDKISYIDWEKHNDWLSHCTLIYIAHF
jgi:DUF2075 family protein